MSLYKKFKSVFQKPKKAKKVKPSVAKVKTIKTPPIKKRHFKEAYKILKEPHVSEKATVLNEQDKYVFKVYSSANKTETKKAVESLYGVRVKDVNIVNIPRKRKIFRGMEGFKSGYKKAIVTLEKGQKIEILPH